MALPAIVITLITVVGRNALGWLNKALEDKRIDDYEWRALAKTSIRMILVTLGAHYGFNADVISANGIALFVEMLFHYIKKVKKVEK